MGQRGGLRQRPSLRSHTPVQGSLEPQGHAGSETEPPECSRNTQICQTPTKDENVKKNELVLEAKSLST